jgi:hypothetical protein
MSRHHLSPIFLAHLNRARQWFVNQGTFTLKNVIVLGNPFRFTKLDATHTMRRLRCAGAARPLFRFHQRHVNQVFAQKPNLQFVSPDHITHHQVIGAIVAEFGGASRQWPGLLNNDLMCVD